MNIIKRGKQQFRIHHTLSNGQHISMYSVVDKFDYKPTPYVVASIGLCISKNKRSCNDWYEGKKTKGAQKIRFKATGRVGLEGLLWAKKALKKLELHLLNEYNIPLWIKIEWADEQRLKVYSRLEKDGYYFINWRGDDCLIKTLRDYKRC